MMRIVADSNIPFIREALTSIGEVRCVPGRHITADIVRDADALLVRSVTPVNGMLLDGSRVRFVATATIGVDHIDRSYLAAQNIGFACAAGSNANSVAEYVIAALLELAHQRGFCLHDKTLGVVGVGNVGRRVVRYATALGMRVLQNDPPRQRTEGGAFVSLDRILADADIITLHVPLTQSGPDATRHLFTPWRGIILNTSRGAVLDNHALLTAPLDGLVLDVFEGEPKILPGLIERATIVTPHIAGYSFDGKVNGTQMVYAALCRHFGLQSTWTPNLPAVPPFEVVVKPGEDDEAALRRVVRHCYEITADDARLRAAPERFDALRAEYPVRREFTNYRLTLHGGSDRLRHWCTALGFRLEV